VDILSTLNNKPIPKYAFAFKRSEYEEVSMSFEFEQEEQAKKLHFKREQSLQETEEHTKAPHQED